ncbi:MAG: MOSC N-terminal beta barrel domain-containing protein [Lautropia sp.]|nr:MOSC N-terminal beta barrel domain-containing protein [Lautropia sp.]
MVKVDGLFVYPVKSCAGIPYAEAALLETGLAHDRQWMLVDADGHFMTQRAYPAMASIQTALEDGYLVLRAPGMADTTKVPIADFDCKAAPRLQTRVWKTTVETLVEHAGVNEWLCQYLGQAVRLVRADPGFRRVCEGVAGMGEDVTTWLSDRHPLLVISQASLNELNQRLARHGEKPVAMQRFRPNIVLDDAVLAPHDEDDMALLRGPDYVLSMIAPCARCTIPNLNVAEGIFEAEPARTMREYRLNRKGDNVLFGMHAFVKTGAGRATIRVGDALVPE